MTGEESKTGTLTGMSSGPHITATSGVVSTAVSASAMPKPMTFAPGGIVQSPARAAIEHIPVPHRVPKRVLVAFLDEEGKHEPFWAAYLAPLDYSVVIRPDSPEDASITLELSLVKRFEQ